MATRAFALLRKLSKEGKLTSEETHGLVEIQREMGSANIIAQFGSKLESGFDSIRAELEALEAGLEAQNSKYTLLLWFIGVGVGLILASNFVN